MLYNTNIHNSRGAIILAAWIPEALQHIVNFFIIIPTLLILVALAANFLMSSQANLDNFFTDLCSKGAISTIAGITYDAKTALVQVVIPNNNAMRFTYPRNTFIILSSLFDSNEGNLNTSSKMYEGLFNSRNNANLLQRCSSKACFCAVRSEMDFLTFLDFSYTMCFPRLYTFNKAGFDLCAQNNANWKGSDMATFKYCVDQLKQQLTGPDNSEAGIIRRCFETTSTYSFDYSGSAGKYILTMNNGNSDLQTKSGDVLVPILQDLYGLSNAGLFTEVLTCIPIPTKSECSCPYLHGNTMNSGRGVFIGIAGSKTEAKRMDITTFVLKIDSSQGAACSITADAQ
ncbi:Uncharacterised protein [Candidatus Tiddalikarchaeum anstoanum]|nr:Uncharacterised protein [Candidatus Tiddalikarchaeum anstoanum]